MSDVTLIDGKAFSEELRGRIGQEVIRPRGQAVNQVLGVVPCGQQDEVAVELLSAVAHGLADVWAVHSGHHPIDYSQGWRIVLGKAL